MSATLTTQAHLYGFSGTHNWADGSGMHTWITRDMPEFINNFGGYVNLRTSYIGSARSANWPSNRADDAYRIGYVERLLHSSSREIYLAQCPVRIPTYAKRMLWTAGMEIYDGGGGGATCTQVKVYLTARPYVGDAATSSTSPAFDTTQMSALARSSSKTMTMTAVTYANALADDSTTGITPCIGDFAQDIDGDYLAYLVVTGTGDGTGTSSWLRICDFTYWFLYE